MISNEAECARSGEALVQEYRLSRADGRDRLDPRRDDRRAASARPARTPLFFGVFLDVSDRKRMEAELERLALYDSLTGLPNRALFGDRLAPGARRAAARDARHRRLLPRPRPLQADQRQPRPRRRRRGAARGGRRASSGCCGPRTPWRASAATSSRSLCESVGGVLEAVGDRRPAAARARAAAARRRRGAAAERQHRHRAGRARRRRRMARGWSRTPTPRCTGPRSAAARAPSCSTCAMRERAVRGDVDRAGAAARRSSAASCGSTTSRS